MLWEPQVGMDADCGFSYNDAMLYAVLIEDRHVDIEVELFRTKEAAIQRCKEVYWNRVRLPVDPDLAEENEESGGVYWKYSVEGDCVHWMEVEEPSD